MWHGGRGRQTDRQDGRKNEGGQRARLNNLGMTSSCRLELGGSIAFFFFFFFLLCFLVLSFQAAPPELFVNTDCLAKKHLPTSKSGREEQETHRWLGNHSLAYRKLSQRQFFSVSHPSVLSSLGEHIRNHRSTLTEGSGARQEKGATYMDWRVLPWDKSWGPHVDSAVCFLLECLARHGGRGQKTSVTVL